MRDAEVNGCKFAVDDDKFKSWGAFKLMGVISDENRTPYERTACMFKLIEAVTDLKEADIIELAGGEDADAQAVFELLAAIISEAAPKN